MSKRALVIFLSVIPLLLLAKPTAIADPSKSRSESPRESRNEKTEKVKCKKTETTTRFPKSVEMPKGVSKKLPPAINFETNCGQIVIETFPRQAPLTLTVISRLIRSGYYDKTICHRLTTEVFFFLQCGDPTGTGFGSPDFDYKADNLPTTRDFMYTAGTVAMANTSFRRNGSQFMIFYEDSKLPTGYTVWGKVTSGLEIVRFIAEGGVKDGGSDGAPLRTIAIDKATTGN